MSANPVYDFDGLTHSQRAIVMSVARMVNSGAEVDEIADEIGLPRSQVAAILRESHFATVCAWQKRRAS
jgi:hypothetical protein